jgi:modulator of FtsH protease
MATLTDIYKPELWESFFVMIGGGVAALTGLVFVALSLSLEEMTKEATPKYRSINTLAGLTAVFVRCGLVLMGGQNHTAIAMEWLITASIGVAIFLYGFRQAFKFGSQPSKHRLAIGSSLYLAEITGAIALLAGSLWGLYLAAAAMVLNVAFMISAAWLLVVGVFQANMGKLRRPAGAGEAGRRAEIQETDR